MLNYDKRKALKINYLHLEIKIRSFIMLIGMAEELQFYAFVKLSGITENFYGTNNQLPGN